VALHLIFVIIQALWADPVFFDPTGMFGFDFIDNMLFGVTNVNK